MSIQIYRSMRIPKVEYMGWNRLHEWGETYTPAQKDFFKVTVNKNGTQQEIFRIIVFDDDEEAGNPGNGLPGKDAPSPYNDPSHKNWEYEDYYQLVYAKVKIKFDANPIKDPRGNKIEVSSSSYYKTGYLFYKADSGISLYFYNDGVWTQCDHPNLHDDSYTSGNCPYSSEGNFHGWYITVKNKNNKNINKMINLSEVLREDSSDDFDNLLNSDIFNYESNGKIKEITAKGAWSLRKYNVIFYNFTDGKIDGESNYSTVKYKGETINDHVIDNTVWLPHGTDLVAYANTHLKSPKLQSRYYEWALNNNYPEIAAKLKKSPPKFLGWNIGGVFKKPESSYYFHAGTPATITPVFQSTVIWAYCFREYDYSYTYSKQKIKHFNAKEVSATTVAKYEPSSADIGKYKGKWVYNTKYFPLERGRSRWIDWVRTK